MGGLPRDHEYRRISGFGYVPKPKGSATKESGEAKVRPEVLQNKADKKSSKSRVFNAPISSAGSVKKPTTSKGGRVAALLQSKDSTKTKDKLG